MIIIFDGQCNFCNGWARFVVKRDRRQRFHFAAAQSKSGAQMLRERSYPTDYLKTIVLIDGARSFEMSEAIIRVICSMGGIWSAAWLLMIIPKRIRDAGYSAFARRRYGWFGRSASCPLPEAQWKDRFLD